MVRCPPGGWEAAPRETRGLSNLLTFGSLNTGRLAAVVRTRLSEHDPQSPAEDVHAILGTWQEVGNGRMAIQRLQPAVVPPAGVPDVFPAVVSQCCTRACPGRRRRRTSDCKSWPRRSWRGPTVTRQVTWGLVRLCDGIPRHVFPAMAKTTSTCRRAKRVWSPGGTS